MLYWHFHALWLGGLTVWARVKARVTKQAKMLNYFVFQINKPILGMMFSWKFIILKIRVTQSKNRWLNICVTLGFLLVLMLKFRFYDLKMTELLVSFSFQCFSCLEMFETRKKYKPDLASVCVYVFRLSRFWYP